MVPDDFQGAYLLRKRSRPTTKQAPMADCCGSPLPSSPAEKHRKPTSFFGSPRALFTGITSKGGFAAADIAEFTTMSPTSILDTKPFSAFKNPFWSETQATPKSQKPESRIHWDSFDSRWVGLGLVDALTDDKSDLKSSKPESRMVLFGSQLKIQIPPLPPSVLSPVDSPKSPRDFGIKTRNSHVGVFSPVLSPLSSKKSAFGSSNSGVENDSNNSPGEFAAPYLSATEMELSEEYTCVISRGPNPRTTHIFDDCIIQSCCGVVDFSASGKMNGGFLLSSGSRSYPSESFLSFCYNCKNNLGLGKDIYMYRGEKAFCSSECRYKEMMLEEEEEEEEGI